MGVEAEDLSRAVKLCQIAHQGVAAKLVPGGRSLLQQSAESRRVHDDAVLHGVLFDNYFLTLRATVPWSDIVVQMLRRLVAIAQDVTTNGLSEPCGEGTRDSSLGRLPAELRRVESGFLDIAFRVARSAICLTTGDEKEGAVAIGLTRTNDMT
ncbi:hypothetical protein ACH47C_19480 [Streptomyces rishiriensis]|uniref:hypothetical protein n=1 Tax=Streptomyces rishiriensis TaxID=68264 RepID=UPI0033EE3DD0